MTIDDLSEVLKDKGQLKTSNKLNVWRALIIKTSGLVAVCRICDKRFRECRCPENGHAISQTLWVHTVVPVNARLTDVSNWGFKVAELKTIKATDIDTPKYPFRDFVMEVVAALVALVETEK
ncbi:MAG TPA: hypothetical protein VM581_02395 [Magnetospirillaceae bacterium]|nr:hypothetical protein [Magnetospirillaceae bacterium]